MHSQSLVPSPPLFLSFLVDPSFEFPLRTYMLLLLLLLLLLRLAVCRT
jgi:hypothetical protein